MRSLTDTSLEIIDLTKIVGDIETPCDYSEEYSCNDSPARWALHLTVCSCGVGGVRLACTDCKDQRLKEDSAVACDCGEVTAPARLAYARIEAL